MVVFTNDNVKSICREAKGRGMLGAAMKVGFEKQGGTINVSILNPEYLFYAYFRDNMDNSKFKSSAMAVSRGIMSSVKGIGTLQEPFGSDLTSKQLKKYRYMMGMPYFDDPVKLAEFDNFQQGISTIRKNLKAGKGNTKVVYEIIDESTGGLIFRFFT